MLRFWRASEQEKAGRERGGGLGVSWCGATRVRMPCRERLGVDLVQRPAKGRTRGRTRATSAKRKTTECWAKTQKSPTENKRNSKHDLLISLQHNTTIQSLDLPSTTQQHDLLISLQHNTTQHTTTQRNTPQHNTTQHNATQHSKFRSFLSKRGKKENRFDFVQ